MLDELKSPSDTAAIPAATSIASVPVVSSGAWKSIRPITSSAAISVSPVCKVKTIGLSSPVAVCLKFNPVSATWVTVTSWSSPNLRTALSESNNTSSVIVRSLATVKLPATAIVELATVALGVTVKWVT